MAQQPRTTAAYVVDLQGIGQLLVTATTSVADIVEAMHHAIASPAGWREPDGRTRGITGLVYGSVRGVTRVVGGALDLTLGPLAARSGAPARSREREAVVAALNGVLGDHLSATENPLAIQMALRGPGASAAAPTAGTATAGTAARGSITGKVAVLVHGLCMNDLQWTREGHDHGAALARDLGFTPLYLHYNSGLHISENGRAFASLLEQTLARWPQPVQQLVIIGHSMGGLVTRSACHVAAAAGHAWPRHLRAILFLGTPHHGAPLERGGHWFNLLMGAMPYAAPLSRLGHVRSAGITDLRHGYLREEDWQGIDRFAPSSDLRRPLPLPDGVRCYAMAAVRGALQHAAAEAGGGDGLVPLEGALGQHPRPEHCLGLPETHTWVGQGMHHLDLLARAEVYTQLRRWLGEG